MNRAKRLLEFKIHFLAVFGAGNLLSVEREYEKLKGDEYV